MNEPIKYFQVNWINGMKIGKDHFKDQENAFSDQIKDSIASRLNTHNYGLLSPLAGKQNSLNIWHNLDNQKILRLKITECRAITLGGARIEISDIISGSNQNPIPYPETTIDLESKKDGIYYITLSVNPFSRVAFGGANPDEDPPRRPYTIPQYKISTIPEDELSKQQIGPFHLTIGKMSIVDGRPSIVENYIPPCVSINSHPDLIDFHSSVDDFYVRIEKFMVEIIQKLKQTRKTNKLADSMLIISNRLLPYISMNTARLRWELINEPPIGLLVHIAAFAHSFRTILDTEVFQEREEIINFFTDWCDIPKGKFDNILNNCMNFNYHHIDIFHNLEQVNELMKIIYSIFEKTSKLDFITTKQPGPVIGEVKEEKKSKFSFLQ